MQKILLLSTRADDYAGLIKAANLSALGEITFQPTEDCEIVFGEPNLIRDALPSLPHLKWAQSTWAGVELLVGPAARCDYVLTNARGVYGGLISEFVFGYLLAHERRIFQRHEAQKNKIWDDSVTGRLQGKTIGLIGVGSIGAELARTAKFFGMGVWGYTRGSETSKYVDRYFHPLESDDKLPSQQQAFNPYTFARGLDYLVCVLPTTTDTRKIVNAELLRSLPPHALFINVGRGQAVDEAALAEVLAQNIIAGAILDVFEQEPLPKEHPFWTIPNLLMTFHTSGPSFPEDIAKIFFENYYLYIEGKPLKHQVDFKRGY